MKISKREKTLLFVLVMVVLLYVYYQFLLVPQQEAIHNLTQDLQVMEQERDIKRRTIASEPRIDEEIKSHSNEILVVSEEFFGELEQEDIILILNDFLVYDAFNIPSVNFSEPRIETIGEASEGQEAQTLNLKINTAQFNYESGYQRLLDLLNHLRNYEQRIAINSMNLQGNQTEALTGTITLDFYSVPQVAKYYPGKPETIAYVLKDDQELGPELNPFFRLEENDFETIISGETSTAEEQKPGEVTRPPATDRPPAPRPAPPTYDRAARSAAIRARSVEKENEWLLVVEKGDTIFSICMAFYDDYSQVYRILDKNQINNRNYIEIGRTLIIPK